MDIKSLLDSIEPEDSSTPDKQVSPVQSETVLCPLMGQANLDELTENPVMIAGDVLPDLCERCTLQQITDRMNAAFEKPMIDTKQLTSRFHEATRRAARDSGEPREAIQDRIDAAQLAHGIVSQEELDAARLIRQRTRMSAQERALKARAHFDADVAELHALASGIAALRGDRLIYLAGRYSRAQLAEHLASIYGASDINASLLAGRLRVAIVAAASRDRRAVEDIQREIAIARREHGVVETDKISRIRL
ncbi:hypothetical protein LTR86_008623 [Recurvomyces mirabilis]|nr:hypothetical protein LTR86_008623 [Recurvomyces mirabilis]